MNAILVYEPVLRESGVTAGEQQAYSSASRRYDNGFHFHYAHTLVLEYSVALGIDELRKKG